MTQGEEEQAQAFRDLFSTMLDTAEIIQNEGLRLRQEPELMPAMSPFDSYLASGMAMQADQFLGVLDQDDIARMINLHERAFHAYESAGKDSARTRPGKKGFLTRLRQGQRATRRALLQANLAGAYLYFNQGDFGRALEAARTHYQSALATLEGKNLPEVSAPILANLGNLLLVYPTEHREGYARSAIAAFSGAKEALAPYACVVRALSGDFRGRKISKALPVMLRQLPKVWGAALRGIPSPIILLCAMDPTFIGNLEWGLGIAHRQLGQTDEALEHFAHASERFPEDRYPKEHAAIELSKGQVYVEARSEEPQRDLLFAFRHFRKALDYCDEVTAPKTYAIALLRYCCVCLEAEDRPVVVKPEVREKHLDFLTYRLRIAAQIARTERLHAVLEEALASLGKVYALRGDRARAYRALALASRVVERRHAVARTPRLKMHVGLAGARLYERLIGRSLEYACAQGEGVSGSEPKRRATDVVSRSALSFAERGRTRFLQDLLATRDLLPANARPGDLRELFALRRLWLETDLRVVEQESSSEHVRSGTLRALQSRRNALEAHYGAELERVRGAFGDPQYDPDRPIAPVRYRDIRSMIDALSAEKGTALVEYYITDRQLAVFVVLPSSSGTEQDFVFGETGVSCDELEELAQHWFQGYAALHASHEQCHPVQWERKYLLQTLRRLGRAVETPSAVIAAWEQNTQRCIRRIIVVPHRFLHTVPLHAVRLPNGRLWGETVSIQYVPSASVLFRLLHQSPRGDIPSPEPLCLQNGGKVLAVSYAPPRGALRGEDRALLFTACEARAVAAATGGEVLEGSEATPRRVMEAIQDTTYVHLACHGAFNAEAPLEAGLELAPEKDPVSARAGMCAAQHEQETGRARAGEEKERRGSARLSLGEIFERLHLPQARLVVLSACDTGIPKIEACRDEYIGLPAGFLYAGARTVVSTLWPISDVATWLLMQEMARGLAGGVKPPEALARAQHTLRHLSVGHVAQQIFHAARAEKDCERRDKMLEEGQRMRTVGRSEQYPFASPYWWAGFTVSGLG